MCSDGRTSDLEPGDGSSGVHSPISAAHKHPMSNQSPTASFSSICGWKDLLASDRVALTPTEVARLLRVDRRTVSRAIEDGDLPGVRIGRQLFISRVAFIKKFEMAS